MKKVLVVGDIYTETQFFTDTIPQENEFAFASEAVATVGSKTINVARTLAKLGVDVAYYGVVGADIEANQVIEKMSDYGINPFPSREASLPTGKIAVITPKSGKSSIILSAGANQLLSTSMINALEAKLTGHDCIYTSTALPLESLYTLVATCRKLSIPIFLDIPNQQTELDLGKITSVDFFMPNRQEAALLVGKPINTLDDARVAAKSLREKILGNIIITLDKDGCLVLARDTIEPQHYPAKNVVAIDETGAGDIFRGALVHKYLETIDLEVSIKYALDLATNSVLVKGVDASIDSI